MKSLRSFLVLLGFIVLSFSATLPAVFSSPSFYGQIARPSWSPPPWIFGPVWTALYTMMGIAAWLVWRQGGFAAQKRPLTLFLVQLTLNALWTPIFFGARQIGLAAVEIVILWIAILMTMVAFFRVNRVAGSLFVPYLAWVSFAAVLNITLWWLNRS
jgi:benzodiazapine receptor